MSHRDEAEASPWWRATERERNVYKHMEVIRGWVQGWIGEPTIHNLVMHLSGYEAALWVHGIEERDCPPSELFMSWLEKTRYIPPNRGLDDELLHEAWGDNELALENFFKLFAEFGRLRVVLGQFVDIPNGHLPPDRIARMQPVPTRIQLAYLQPGTWCFVKEWIADRVRCRRQYLYEDGRAAKNSVESELGIGPEAWSATTVLLRADRRGGSGE
jgi:hypothetical protein